MAEQQLAFQRNRQKNPPPCGHPTVQILSAGRRRRQSPERWNAIGQVSWAKVDVIVTSGTPAVMDVLADDEAAALVVVKLELTHRGSFGGLGIWRFDEAEKLAPAMAAPATQSVRQPGLCHYRGFGQGSAAQYAR
jgi:hypothetical protein